MYSGDDPVNLYDPSGLTPIIPSSFQFPCTVGAGEFAQSTSCEQYSFSAITPMTLAQYDDVHPTSMEQQWDELGEPCQQALQTAMPGSSIASMLKAVNRADAAQSTLMAATAGTSIDWTMLAAIGIRETGFWNQRQICAAGVTWGDSGCQGAGIFQITVNAVTGVTEGQAGDLAWAANYAAQLLNSDMATLSAKFPNFTAAQLLQATAASYNFGTGNISGNPNTIDVGTSPKGHGNYGSNIVNLLNCF
ncbi:MAG TPA: hypothetical protein VH640_31965 [Bryobacteraceae bacterium]